MRPKQILDQETLQKNKELSEKYTKLTASISAEETEILALQRLKEQMNTDIKNLGEQATVTADTMYKKAYDLMQEKMSQSAEIVSKNYQQAEDSFKKEYLLLLEENAKHFANTINLKQVELATVEKKLSEMKEKVDAAIEADKRKMLSEKSKEYYKIIISDDDKEDIALLKEVIKKLKKDPEPINKII